VRGFDRIVFFGTPEFAIPSLDALVAAGRTPILVVSRPARPGGRGRKLIEPPVAARARELGIPVAQPEKVRAPEFLERLRSSTPDLAVVVAFGQIFPRALLELPPAGCVNVHASLLPRWRGAAPIQAAIAAGDAETGVSIQQMAEGLDSGPVYAARRTPIGDDETAGELSQRLARLGAELLLEVLPALEAELLAAAPQDESEVTLAPKLLSPQRLDPARPAAELSRLARAATPEPGAFLETRNGERLKLLRVHAVSERTAEMPGTVVRIFGEDLAIAAGDGGVLALARVQRAGGRPVSGRDLANGLRLAPGDRFA